MPGTHETSQPIVDLGVATDVCDVCDESGHVLDHGDCPLQRHGKVAQEEETLAPSVGEGWESCLLRPCLPQLTSD